MPEPSLIVMLAITVVSAVVIFKVAKGMIQGVLLAGAVVSILTAVGGGLVVKDALEFKDNLQASDNMILLSDNEWAKLTGGIVIKGQAGAQAGEQDGQAVDNKEGKGGNAEALTVAELEKLNPLFAKKDYGSMLGKNYKLIIIKESSVTGSLPERLDLVFVISEYKKGNAVVYPETPFFKAIKLIPFSLFRGVTEKALQQAKGAAAQAMQ